jgi:phage terminase large subunit-like protein
MQAVTYVIENGLVVPAREGRVVGCLLHELTAFPTAKHGDQADSPSQALDWGRAATRFTVLLSYYKREMAKMPPTPAAFPQHYFP